MAAVSAGPTRASPAGGKGRGLREILLAVDDSPGSRAAEIAAAALASRAGAEVIVVHVWNRGSWSVDIEREARELADGVVSDLAAFGVRAKADVRSTASGDVGAEIEAAVADHGPDLVLMGSRRRSDIGRLLLGSVSQQVVAGVPVPVMLVRSGRHSVARRSRILIALQGDEDIDALARTTAMVAEPGAEALVLHLDTAGARSPEGPARLAAILRRHGIRARARSAAGTAGVPAALARAARIHRADLVVLGSRRLPSLSALVRASVSQEVAHLVDSLVLIGPPPGHHRPPAGE